MRPGVAVMSVIAEYSVDASRLVLAETLKSFPGIRLDVEDSVATDPDLPILFTWVTCDDHDEFEAAMREDPTVADPEPLSQVGGRRLYRIQITGETDIVLYREWVEIGAERLESHYYGGRWHIRTRFPDRETLAEYQSYLSEEGLDFRLNRLYDSDREEEIVDHLTPQQRETLVLAFEMGFFDIPRKATMEDLADRLDVSNQAVSERLRRGYARLVEDTLF